MLAFQHYDEITARFSPQIIQNLPTIQTKDYFQAGRKFWFQLLPRPLYAQAYSVSKCSWKDLFAQLSLAPDGLVDTNAIRITVLPAEGWKWLPSTPGSAHTAPHSPALLSGLPRAGAQGLQQAQQEATQPPPYRTQHLLRPVAEACSACFVNKFYWKPAKLIRLHCIVEELQQIPYGPTRLKYLLLGLFRNGFQPLHYSFINF